MKALRTDRLKVISAIIIMFALVLVVRLYMLQVMQSDAYTAQADRQHVRRGENVFDRGSILFQSRSGELVSAATLQSGYTIAINPQEVVHPEDVYNALSGILATDEDSFLRKLGKTEDPYEEIARRVDEPTALRIEALNIAGIQVIKERWRFYPAGRLASNTLGFLGYDAGNRFNGRYGLERYYDDVLSRDEGTPYTNFFVEMFSDIGALLGGERAEGDIVTTIEPSVQTELEREIAKVMTQWRSDLTGGIVMDPYTGEVVALAVSPSFDPNNVRSEKSASIFGNPMIEGVYEMGSIIKPLAMAAGIDAGAVTPKTTYLDEGYVMVNGAKISNFDGKGRGEVTMQRVLNDSLNTGMAFVAKKLGNDRLTKYFTEYGLGEETGIDLPGEVPGLIANLKSPRDIEHVTAAFGQGIAVTPIETIRALSALGNGGFLPNPHVVKRIDYLSGITKTLSYDNTRQVLAPATSEEITRMLVTVVDTALLGGTVKLPHYSIAAKTGTAQMAKETGKGYYDDRFLHSFFGYFPAYKPRFIVFLYTVYPKGAQYASHTLTYPFIDLAKFLINYYDIAPDR
ncbi:MAG: penicillin-binding protein 2 [Candidatus Paceibacterota bacterium]|jgi:cell division protein FtsI (penicillin-binding protein 3)/stage V sporulation protein D (sporulation-specific penicillin-binding protein)